MKALFFYLLLIGIYLTSHVKSTEFVIGALVDAFTKEIGQGNPAGVILSSTALTDEWMKTFAKEINHSETAFLTKIEQNKYTIRWFTPKGHDVPVCYHGTLAAVHFLKSKELIDEGNVIEFQTEKEGSIYATIRDEMITLNVAHDPPSEYGSLDGLEISGAVSFQDKKLFISKNLGLAHPSHIQFIGKAKYDCLIQVTSPEEVLKLEPTLVELAKIKGNENWSNFEGFIVTAPYEEESKEKHDFVSRYFGPKIGIDEDPVTGSAHCILVPYYYQKEHVPNVPFLKKKDFLALQGNPLTRQGEIRCSYPVGENKDKVLLRGTAVKVWDLSFDHYDEKDETEFYANLYFWLFIVTFSFLVCLTSYFVYFKCFYKPNLEDLSLHDLRLDSTKETVDIMN